MLRSIKVLELNHIVSHMMRKYFYIQLKKLCTMSVGKSKTRKKKLGNVRIYLSLSLCYFPNITAVNVVSFTCIVNCEIACLLYLSRKR